ncbi:MAG: cation diffusion facilitator family transporter [Wujia sp.]
MGDILVKKFIKDYENVTDVKVRERYGILSSFVGIVCNVILFVSKFIMGTLTNSISIISDGFNNLSDCASCIITMFGYRLAAKPADKDHPFGHGRMEYLTSLVLAMIILLVGLELGKSSILKIIHPDKLNFSIVAVAVLVLSILIKLFMRVFNNKYGRRINSSVMLATAKDSTNDMCATTATLIALLLSLITEVPVDGIMGILVSVMIVISGYEIIKDTVDELLGSPVDEELAKKIRELVKESWVALDMHDLIIHSYGPGKLIGSVHVEVDSRGDIMEIHDAIDELERNIMKELNVLMTIHMDPIEEDDEKRRYCKDILLDIIHNIDTRLTIHDFRIVAGPTHTNLIFDMVIPYDCHLKEQDIRNEINEGLSKLENRYYAVITFDTEFV